MMKRSIKIFLCSSLLIAQTALGWAATSSTTSLTLSATMPAATAVNVSLSVVTGTTMTSQSGATMDFGTASYNSTSKTYQAKNSFAIDLGAATGGSGTPSLTFTYTEGNNPNGSTKGLGEKASISFAKVTDKGQTMVGNKTLLKSITSVSMPASAFAGGSARVYVSVCNGSSDDPAGCTPLSPADAPGQYTGTLTVSTTIN